MGLVRTVGRIWGSRGRPAFKLKVNPDSAFGIGLNIDRDHLTLVVIDLSGEVRSRVTREIAFAMPKDVRRFVERGIKSILSSAGVDREGVLGVGVAIPDDLGPIQMPGQPAGYELWNEIDIAAVLAILPWPIHSDNDAAAAALGEAQHPGAYGCSNFFHLLITDGTGRRKPSWPIELLSMRPLSRRLQPCLP